MAADLRVNVSEAGGAHGPPLSVHISKVVFFSPRCYLSGFVIGGEFWTLFLDSAPVYKTPRSWRSVIFSAPLMESRRSGGGNETLE